MDITTINMIRSVLPEDMIFPYYPDRESAWVLAQLMPGDAAVAALRDGPAAKLLTRPLVKPLVAACGGQLRQRDVLALAHAEKVSRWGDVSAAAQAALAPVFANTWQDYTLSFDVWGERKFWQYDQISRPGSNLVVQLGFPSEHAQVFGRFFDATMRRKLEAPYHPIRLNGPPTLAWARLDIDLETGTALVEEVQSDWLRFVAREKLRQLRDGVQERQLRVLLAYEQALIAHYAKAWPRVMLLSALYLLREEFAVRDIWMHRPEGGAMLKGIDGALPPRSLYTDLPRAFCFAPTREAPPFLAAARKRHLARLGKAPGPLFWLLSL